MDPRRAVSDPRSTRCEPSIRSRSERWRSGGEQGLPLHAHVSEQLRENTDCLAAHGVALMELLDGRSAEPSVHRLCMPPMSPTPTSSASPPQGSRCCVCPTTERELADGIGPTAAWRAAGVELCAGSDSNAVIDPFEETRAVELDERLRSMQRGVHRPADLLTAASTIGYECLGWPDGAAGGRRPCRLRDHLVRQPAPPVPDLIANDPLAAVLFAAAPTDVCQVVVGGNVIVSDARTSEPTSWPRLSNRSAMLGRPFDECRLDRGPRDRSVAHQRLVLRHGPTGELTEAWWSSTVGRG